MLTNQFSDRRSVLQLAFDEYVGWFGTICFIVAYALVSTEKVAATGRSYQWINLVGGLAYGFHAYVRTAWPVVGLEVVWVSIAVFTLVRVSIAKQKIPYPVTGDSGMRKD
ncbi:MAG: hypothetical protein O2794_00490 [bacterium]|nr:hypothetical protein [bacterium]